MKLKTKILIITVLALLAVLIGASNVKAAEGIASMNVVDKNGKEMTYIPPESGGPTALLNTDKDYTNCNYIMYVDNNYGEKIETDFGTFTFKETTQNGYIYTCPVKVSDIADKKSGAYDLTFKATNTDTKEVDTITATFLFYKLGFKSNANLKVGNEYIIKNGKIVKATISNDNYYAYYYEHDNTLNLKKYNDKNVDICYSNMGNTFNIESFGNTEYTIFNNENVKNLLEKLGFKKNNNDVYEYNNIAYIEISQFGYSNAHRNKCNELIEKLKSNGYTLEGIGEAGGIGGQETGYSVKNDEINFGSVIISTTYKFKVIVPDNIEDTEEAYTNYATKQIKKYIGVEEVELNKISPSWYNCPSIESEVIIQKEEGTLVGNNIYVNGLEQNVNVKVAVKENALMSTEANEKGYTHIIGSYELTLEGKEKLTTPIDITFKVGTNYNGKSIYILHQKKNGSYENFEKTVKDGKVTITVSELSPFVLAVKGESNTNNQQQQTTTPATTNKGEKDDTPKTGTTDIIKYMIPVAVISACGIISLRRKETK